MFFYLFNSIDLELDKEQERCDLRRNSFIPNCALKWCAIAQSYSVKFAWALKKTLIVMISFIVIVITTKPVNFSPLVDRLVIISSLSHTVSCSFSLDRT